MDIRPPDRTATSSARPKPRDGALRRLSAWGACATFAAVISVCVAQTPAGGKRIKTAMTGLEEPIRSGAIQAAPDPLVRSLEARIASLTGDRDHLTRRVAALESGFDDLTGSVRKQATAAPAAIAPAVATAARSEPGLMVVAIAPPMINPLATPPVGIASILPETIALKPPQPAAAASSAAEASTAEAAPAPPVPLPPERVAELTPVESGKPAKPARPRIEFGVELATEANMEGLRKRWAGVKANYGPLLLGLSPVAVRDEHPGSTAVRLVAGPLPSLTAARQLCARFASMNGNCWAARIDPADVIQH